jgi:hypothetical protein
VGLLASGNDEKLLHLKSTNLKIKLEITSVHFCPFVCYLK